MAFIILAVILSFLVIVLFAPLKVVLSFKNADVGMRVSLLGIPIYTNKTIDAVPGAEADVDKKGSIEEKVKEVEKKSLSFGEKIKAIVEISRTAVKLLKRYVSISNIELNIRIGTGDAATTAISVGILWAAVYNLLGIIGRIMYIDNHSVEIKPDYNEEIYLAEGKCIFKSRIAYIIFIVILIMLKINSRKGKED